MLGALEGYVAMGISKDRKMGHDETVACISESSHVTVQRGYNPRNAKYNIPMDNMGLFNLQARKQDGNIYCRFSRHLTSALEHKDLPKIVFDLNDRWYLFLALGSVREGTNKIAKHVELPAITNEQVDFEKTTIYLASSLPVLIQVHACLMIVAWVLVVGLATLISRHYREGFQGETIAGVKIWFHFHRALGICAFLLTITGFIVIAVHADKWTKIAFDHASCGMTVVILVFLQVFGGLIRPSSTSKYRPMFTWFHRCMGKLMHVLAAIAFFLAYNVRIFPAAMQRFGLIVFGVWFVVQILTELFLEGWKVWKRNAGSPPDEKTTLSIIEGHEKHVDTSPGLVILVLYLIVETAFVVAGLCSVLLF